MPRGDQSGPNGNGPMTGRGAGFCNGANQAGFMNAGGGQGFGRGLGRQGRGFSGGFNVRSRQGFGGGRFDYTNITGQESQVTVQTLKQQAATLSNEIEMIKNRIQKMEEEKNRD